MRHITTSVIAIAIALAGQSDYAQATQPNADAGHAEVTQARGDGPVLGEIVVLAQRRAENMQNVPVAVSAMTAATLERQGTSNTLELPQSFPSLIISRSPSAVQPFLRGVGNPGLQIGNDPSVAVYIDGVYQAAPVGMLFSFNNIDHIEVLKGPQGTLFGRNATGGAIQIITKDPTPGFQGRVKLGYATFDTFQSSAYISGGSDRLAADLSVIFNNQRDGWGVNRFQGGVATLNNIQYAFPAPVDPRAGYMKEFSARSKVVFNPTENFQVKISAYHVYTNGEQGNYRRALEGTITGLGFRETGGFWDYTAYYPNVTRTRDSAIDGTISVDTDIATFKSITSYHHSWANILGQPSASGLPANSALLATDISNNIIQKADTVSQELQLLSNKNSSLEWLAGLYFLRSTSKQDPTDLIVGDYIRWTISRFNEAKNRSLAAFAQIKIPVLSNTNLTLGGRYSWDKIAISSYFLGRNSFATAGTQQAPGVISNRIPYLATNFERFTWRVALDHNFTPDVMGFASVNKGYKSGAYNANSPCRTNFIGDCLDPLPPVKPEDILAYEVGLKSELFDRRIRLNGSLYYYDYKNLQVQANVRLPNGLPALTLTNAANSQLYGGEVELTAVVSQNLTANMSVAAEHTKYVNFTTAQIFVPNATPQNPNAGGNSSVIADVSGSQLIRAPKLTLTAGFDWSAPTRFGEFNLNGSWYHNSGYWWDPQNRVREPAYNLVAAAASITLPEGGWKFTVWGKNLLNEQYHAYVQTGTSGDFGQAAAPRTYGISIEKKF